VANKTKKLSKKSLPKKLRGRIRAAGKRPAKKPLQKVAEPKEVILQTWTESERGWGLRPDGYSLHLSEEDMRRYNQNYWEVEKQSNPGGQVPDEYVRPDNNPVPVLVPADVYAELSANATKYGIRKYGSFKVETTRILKVQ
jgi:hypothetical protein